MNTPLLDSMSTGEGSVHSTTLTSQPMAQHASEMSRSSSVQVDVASADRLLSGEEAGFATPLPPPSGGCAAPFCLRLWPGARRVGNMTILWEERGRDIDVEHKTRCIVGPFWPVMLFVTFPLILGVSAGLASTVLPGQNTIIIVVFAILVIFVGVSLALTACTDPGLLRRRVQRPASPEGDSWSYSDQAQTYRPPGAIYCRDCGVVVRGYDHLCPWTGTAIGEKNLRYFYCFVGGITLLLLYVLFVVIYAFADHKE